MSIKQRRLLPCGPKKKDYLCFFKLRQCLIYIHVKFKILLQWEFSFQTSIICKVAFLALLLCVLFFFSSKCNISFRDSFIQNKFISTLITGCVQIFSWLTYSKLFIWHYHVLFNPTTSFKCDAASSVRSCATKSLFKKKKIFNVFIHMRK